ncbi:MAG: pyrimidine dimer DNA glycosylase/endonuclease V [bacterium]
MRLWSIHPKYLDAKGLVALWRETLLAKHVLEGKTTGYRNHPQLERFKKMDNPLIAINYYLQVVHEESVRRRYTFDETKFIANASVKNPTVTSGQIAYEYEHLKKKLAVRDPAKLVELPKLEKILPHPLFIVIPGTTEPWEKL